MGLHELIRYYREKAGLKPKDLARKLRISYSYYTRLERPYPEGKAIPSEDLLRRFVSLVVSDPEERQKAYKELLSARIAILIPPELYKDGLAYIESSEVTDSMPKEFIDRLQSDIDYVGMSKVLKGLGVPQTFVEEVLKGRRVLSRSLVIKMAYILGQPVDEYLILAGYIPQSVHEFFRSINGLTLFFRLLEKVPREEGVVEFLNKIAELVKFHQESLK